MSIPAGTPALSGGRPARLTQDLKSHGPNVQYNISTGLITGCVICAKQDSLSKCNGCKIVRYCGAEHQKLDWQNHKSTCKAIRSLTKSYLIEETRALLSIRGESIFSSSRGVFWKNTETRVYMQARWKVAEELMKVNTDIAVEEALMHLLGMGELNRADNQGVRWLVPALMIRLRRDQDAYDFIKWWATNDDYDFNDTSLPFLSDKKNQDIYESVDGIYDALFLNHLVALTLLKIRLLLDLQILRSAKTSIANSATNTPDIPLSKLSANLQKFAISSATRTDIDFISQDPTPVIEELEKQIKQLYEQGKKINPYLWPALVDPGEHLNVRPGYYHFKSEGEMQYALQYNYNSWVETQGAIEVVRELERKG